MPGTLLQPVAPEERIATLDILRGFALLGILLMNMEAFVAPVLASATGVDPGWTGADRLADALIYFFVQGKFYTLFSLLFGMGFAVMAQRAAAGGRPFAGVYWRRGLALLAIGLVHAVFVWSGDILVTYALLSFLLLAFRDVPARWLAWLGALAYLVAPGLMLLVGLMDWAMSLSPETAAGWKEAMAEAGASMEETLEAQRQAYGSGGYLAAVAQRLRDLELTLSNLVFFGPTVFGMFLVGAAFAKSGAIARPDAYPRLFAALRWLVLPLGLLIMYASFRLEPTLEQGRLDLRIMSAHALAAVAGALMCLGYLAWIVRALRGHAGAGALGWLAPAGRMALSNYLLQSMVCTLAFYGYGLGYFERLPRAWQVPFALALFALQALASRWWLARFRFGPAEWLWRSLTYLRWQPMRRGEAA